MALARLFDLEPLGDDAWRAWTPRTSARADIFGGQVAGQALRAATLTVEPGYLPNSVHCYFLRRGRPDLPLDSHVGRVRTGRTYASRSVDVRQDGRTIFTMLASFHVDEPGQEYDHPMPADVPDPEAMAGPDRDHSWEPEFDLRPLAGGEPIVRWWGRVEPPFPADPALHLCALLYASDMMAGGAAMAAVGFPSEPPEPGAERPAGNFGSLDHAVWFHRVPTVEEWFFCEVRPLTVRDSRGLVLGRMFDRDGRHLATFTQEMFLKVAPT